MFQFVILINQNKDMKKRIPVILSLVFLFVSLGSIKAQNPFYPLDNYNPGYFENSWPGISHPDSISKIEQKASDKFESLFSIGGPTFPIPYPYVFGECTHTLRFDLSPIQPLPDSSYIWFESYHGSDDFPNDIGNNVSLTSDKFLIPKNATYIDMPFQTYRVPDELNMKIFSVIVYINQTQVEFFPFFFINKLTYSIKYERPTVHYNGILEVNINDATGNAVYSLNEGKSWKQSTDTATKSEIKNLTDYDFIYIKEPLSCDFIKIPIEKEGGPPVIYRQVRIPQVTDAILDKSSGLYSILTKESFMFTIQPTGENVGKIPVVQTNRTSIPDSEGVTITKDEDEIYTITILHIQQDIDISIDFATGNELVQSENIRTHNGQLYITTTTSGNVKVYNATGALVKTIPTVAGETVSTSLPTGFYIINMDGKSYKVVCK